MQYPEKEKILRRISIGKFYGRLTLNNGRLVSVCFFDPSPEIIQYADFIYDNIIEDNKNDPKVLTLEDTFIELEKQGIWSEDKEKQLDSIVEKQKQLKNDFAIYKFNETKKDQIKEGIAKLQKVYDDLYSQRYSLFQSTIEYQAEKASRRYILKNSVELGQADSYMLDDPYFIESLIVYYYTNGLVKEKELRELARSNPWRLSWSLAKETGTPIFSSSATNLTQLQHQLLSWSFIYDHAYKSIDNRPDDQTINDDEMFDIWWEEDQKRSEQEQSNQTFSNAPGQVAGSETIIFTDERGSKKIYDKNSPQARAIIKERYQTIVKKGEAGAKDTDFRDVQRDIRMAAANMGK